MNRLGVLEPTESIPKDRVALEEDELDQVISKTLTISREDSKQLPELPAGE